MKNDITDILFKYTTGEATLEETNEALKEAEAGFRLEPGKNEITPEEAAQTVTGETPEEVTGYGLLDTGTGSMEKVKIVNGKLGDAINQVNPDGTTNMLAFVIIGHKTYSLRQYAKLPRVAYIECDDTMSSRDLVEAIEKSLGIPSGYGTIWRRVNGIRDFFNTNKGYLLIIDEADKLVSKYTQKKMEILRAIFDQSDVGLVIAGEPKLEAQIKTYLARMANRVDFYVSLKGLDPSEVEGYLEGFEVDPDAMVELKARACNMQTGCFRLLDRTLSNVSRILEERGERVVTVKIIEQASSLMML